MPLLRSGSYGHKCRRERRDEYEVSWTVDTKHGRIRYPHVRRRFTDAKGARRFCKKWGCPEPSGLAEDLAGEQAR